MARANRDVRWSREAEADLLAVVEHIARERPATADEVLSRIERRAASLHRAAERGRLVPELQRHGISEYRELIVSVWRLIYRVHSDSVNVVAVVDSRRNLEDVLLLRLTRR